MADLEDVRAFWESAACGERLYLSAPDARGFSRQAEHRYRLEPYIPEFARFEDFAGQRVLEIGVGLGADHQRFAAAGAQLWGIDLTQRAIDLVRRRLHCFGLHSQLSVGNAERLEFEDECFDLVYSWGVLQHTPHPERAVREIFRVLKPGGQVRLMLYQKYSLVGLMLWLRYALLRGRPFTPLAEVYAGHLQGPGTKAYRPCEARHLLRDFAGVRVRIELSEGDLLIGSAGERHRGWLLALARRLWPRWLIRRFFSDRGLFLLLSGRKPGGED